MGRGKTASSSGGQRNVSIISAAWSISAHPLGRACGSRHQQFYLAAGIPGPAANFNNDRSGYTIGAGVEYAFTPNWSAKIEYQHMGFGNKTVTYPFANLPPLIADPGLFEFSVRAKSFFLIKCNSC
jgi:opacity protein-like surface antigen